MRSWLQQPLASAVALVVLTIFLTPQATAQEHIVPLAELQGKLQSAANARTRNIQDIQRVLSYPASATALKSSGVNLQQMRQAIATLSDDELSRLSDRARASEKDVEAGIIVGILALIGLIVVIIIVVSIVAEATQPNMDATASVSA